MNRFLLLFLILFSIKSFAQNDYATIYIYRPGAFTIGSQDVQIQVNGIAICNLKNGSALEYKVFGIKPIRLSVVDQQNNIHYTDINLQKDKTYYFNIKARLPRALGFKLENMDKPLKEGKIKSKDFIVLTDVGILSDIAQSEKGDTEWTYDKLINHWTKNGIADIEGIYERVSAQIEYRLAVLKENNEYKIIYLSGARGTGWNEGDIKATLRKTAQFGIFKSNWRMINKANNKDVNIVFESASMKTISEAGDNSQDLYLKMYPTYDEEANSKIIAQNSNEWKSSGTGFFIDKNGYIATNYHVIKESKEIQINVNKKSYSAKVVISDKQNDLAILKIIDNSFVPLTNLSYNFKSETADVGTSVFALGYPLTSILGEDIKYTTGSISAKSGLKGDITNYQISVPIQPGNSGGPLFDNDGNLIGITSSGINRELDLTENVNYAIKSNYLKLLIDEMDEKIELPNFTFNKTTLQTDKIKNLEKFVVFIKVK